VKPGELCGLAAVGFPVLRTEVIKPLSGSDPLSLVWESWDDALRGSVPGGFLDLRRGGLGSRFQPLGGITHFLLAEGIVGAFKERSEE
jgi:hypothetical protein